MPLMKVKSKIEVKHTLVIMGCEYKIVLGDDSRLIRRQLVAQQCPHFEDVLGALSQYQSLTYSVNRLRHAGILSDKKASNMLSHIMVALQARLNKLLPQDG